MPHEARVQNTLAIIGATFFSHSSAHRELDPEVTAPFRSLLRSWHSCGNPLNNSYKDKTILCKIHYIINGKTQHLVEN